jgi:hypothetical protein
MLRTNLSTKPFYNERGIHAVLGVAGVIVIALTIFNLTQIVVLKRRQSDLNDHATIAENRAHDLVAHANTVRRGLNPKDLEAVSGAAREANSLIGQRLFSWTDLLNRLEATLPDDVRITSMHPVIEKDGKIVIVMIVVGRRVEDIDQFMERLEGTGAFFDAWSRDDRSTDDGSREASVEARYLPK